MASSTRIRRVEEVLQRTLSTLLLREVSDPRLTMTSISDIEVSRDLAHAKVYISVIGDSEKAKSAMHALEKASGYLRRLLGKQTELRIVPELHFHLDTTVERGRKMADLIDKATKNPKGDA